MKYRYTVQQLKQMERCRYLTDREQRVFNLVAAVAGRSRMRRQSCTCPVPP